MKEHKWVLIDKHLLDSDQNAILLFGSVTIMQQYGIFENGQKLSYEQLRTRLHNGYWKSEKCIIKKCELIRSKRNGEESLPDFRSAQPGIPEVQNDSGNGDNWNALTTIKEKTKNKALQKLQEAKTYLDLELISQNDYNTLKKKMAPMILGKNKSGT